MPEPRPINPSLVGVDLELDVGRVAHGGHCVARVDDEADGRVVFVRHALPGERVRVRITEDRGGSFVRADTIEVLQASPDRVEPPCPHAGPRRCGGCDWQHVAPSAQRGLKAQVVREQFARLAGLDVDVTVDALPDGPLHWRTRITYTIDRQGRPGLLRHRSSDIEPIDCCPLGVDGVGDGPFLKRSWTEAARIEVVGGGEDPTTTLLAQPRAAPAKRTAPNRPARPSGRSTRRNDRAREPMQLVEGSERVRRTVSGVAGEPIVFDIAATDFWQVHSAAAQTLADAVLRALDPRLGDAALDLYSGAGLFTAILAQAVGSGGSVVGVESDARSVADAVANLARWPWAQARSGRVTVELLAAIDIEPDLIVLDPPRSGLGATLMTAVLALGARSIAYVSCDPASLARDVRVAADLGWRMAELSAFDAFPMTHHIECVAILTPN